MLRTQLTAINAIVVISRNTPEILLFFLITSVDHRSGHVGVQRRFSATSILVGAKVVRVGGATASAAAGVRRLTLRQRNAGNGAKLHSRWRRNRREGHNNLRGQEVVAIGAVVSWAYFSLLIDQSRSSYSPVRAFNLSYGFSICHIVFPYVILSFHLSVYATIWSAELGVL